MEYNVKLPGPVSLLKESFAMYKIKFNPLIKISLIIFIAAIVVETVFPQKIVGNRAVFSLGNTIGSLAVGILSVLCSIAMVYVINNSLSVKESLQKAPAVFWKYLLTCLLAGLIIGLGFILLIIPGIIFSAWYVFAGLIVILEDLKGMAALRKSKEYVKGHVWEVIVRWLFIVFLAIIIGAVPSGILSGNSRVAGNLYTSIIFLFAYPIIEIYLYIVYMHLKRMHVEVPVVPASVVQ